MGRKRSRPALLLAAMFTALVTFPAIGADEKPDPKALRQKLKAEEAKKKALEAKKAEQANQAEEAKRAALAAEAFEAAKKASAVRKAELAANKLDASGIARLIDANVADKLATQKIEPSPICTDEEFLRRAYLDLTGVIPTAEKAKAFLDDNSENKRAKLIDELLDDPNYGRKHADVWLTKLFPRESNNRFVQPDPFYAWLKEEFNKNTPWDEFVTKLVTAEGTVDENPEITFFLANRSVDKLTDAVTQHFLGVQLTCAQCHNHPFTATRQTEYWGMATFFSKVTTDRPKNTNQGGDNSKLGVREGKAMTKARDFFPESAKQVSAKFLGGPEPVLDSGEPYRPILAQWMTAPDNPFFAKAMVNRTWSELFGQGIVDPVDDLIETNVPTHPELLNILAEQFVASGYDVKALFRGIALSDTYQRSAKPNGSNREDTEWYSHSAIKQMSGEQLFDSLELVLGAERENLNKNRAKAPRGGVNRRTAFVQFYLAGSVEADPTAFEAGIPQMLKQLNSNNSQVAAAARLLTRGLKNDEALEKLYLSTLARRPSAEESKRLTEYLGANTTDGYADVLWAILNSSEFVMIR